MSLLKGKSKLIFSIIVLAAAIISLKLLHADRYLLILVEYIKDAGFTGYILFAIAYIAACVLFMPGFILTLGAGFAYGVIKGTLLVSISSILGASAAFLTGRYFARGWIEKKIEGNIKFKSIDSAVEKEGFKIVFLTRLSPLFPFNLLNYAYGITKVKLSHYFFASWIGMLPATVMYVYLGSLLTNISQISAGKVHNPFEQIFYFTGLLVTVFVTIFVTKIAKKSLQTSTGLKEMENNNVT